MGLNLDDYIAMAENISRILEMQHEWDNIMRKVNIELSENICDLGRKLAIAASNDKKFYEIACLDYSKSLPAHGCFSVAIAEYLIRNKNNIHNS